MALRIGKLRDRPVMNGDGEVERARVVVLLDEARRTGARIRFWWRDDDAMEATPELARLLRLAAAYRVPLGLAVIPSGARHDLLEAIAAAPAAAVLQHGWSHARHNPPGEKKAELGDTRAPETVLAELADGRQILAGLFDAAFIPVLVPPWNRIGQAVRRRRAETGLVGLSTFGPAPDGERHTVNTHLDLIDWSSRQAISRATAYGLLAREIERRLSGDREPVGLLTHHLVHDEAAWILLEELLRLLTADRVLSWPGIRALFDLDAAAAPPSG